MLRAALRRAYLKSQLAVREVVALSPTTMGAITINSVRMSVHDLRRHHRLRRDGAQLDPGTFTGARALEDGRSVAITFSRATLVVRAHSDNVVRVAWGPGPAPLDVATRDAALEAPSSVGVEFDADHVVLRTPAMLVEVSDEGVVVRDAAGRDRYTERPPLLGTRRITLRRVLRDGERLCGLGEQAGALDLSGTTHRLWNRDPGGSWGPGQDPLYCSIPVTVGLHESGPVWAFHENTFEARVSVGAVDHAIHGVTAQFEGGSLVTYVAIGELDEVLTAAALLTGRPAMPPRWALGYHHCRWGWRTDQIVGDVLDGFVDRDIPLSALHLDIDHMDRYRVFTFDKRRFGSVGELARRAKPLGTRLVAIVDPGVRRDRSFDLYNEGVEGGHFVVREDGAIDHGTVWPGWVAFPDFTRPATRAWWGSKYESLISLGISGAWHDMNEPTSITLWGDRTIPRSDRFDCAGRGGDHEEAHNVYGLLMNRAGHEALAAASKGARPFLVSRAGWAGLARYAWHWTADVESSAEGLAQQVATFLGLGMSSVPFTGSDIGGFTGVPSPDLLVRWYELGVLSPFCRTHCVLGAPDREPWRFEQPVEAAITELIRLRYRLLPHLYRLAEEAHRLGHPLWRPVDWPVAGARTGASASAESVLLGNELLVVPVANPATRSVDVLLPHGRWRRLRLCAPLTGAHGEEADLVGGTRVALDAPIGQPIVLQRAGTVVVLDDAWAQAGAKLDEAHSTKRWTLHICTDDAGAASGSGFEDAGDGDGARRADRYTVTSDGEGLTVSWASTGQFARTGAVAVVVHGSRLAAATADGVAHDVEHLDGSTSVRMEGPFRTLVLR